MSTAALHFESVESRDALDGFFLLRVPLDGVQDNNDGTVTFFIPSVLWSPMLETAIREFRRYHADVQFLGAEIIEDRNWNEEWEASVAPMQVTRDLVIAPSWKKDDAKAMGSKYLLTIDPKMSFGTGHHETTRLCLQALESISLRNRRVLDLGTGSGVLAIYALLRGAKKALGIDTDSWSIQNARENRDLNQCGGREFEIRMGTIERVRKHEMFGVVLANLHRNVLLEIPASIRAHAMNRAHIVLSGILQYDSEEIRAAYEKAGFVFIKELQESEWSCLLFQVCE